MLPKRLQWTYRLEAIMIIALLGGMVVGLLISAIINTITVDKLKTRIGKLEMRVEELEAK